MSFWRERDLSALSGAEWESLCDGCGRCCMLKLEDEDTGDIHMTRIACKLLDIGKCRCADYKNRHDKVPDCLRLTPQMTRELSWLPETCAYRLLYDGKALYDWHPLISGTAQTVHDAGISVQGWTVPEFDVPEEDWEDYILEE